MAYDNTDASSHEPRDRVKNASIPVETSVSFHMVAEQASLPSWTIQQYHMSDDIKVYQPMDINMLQAHNTKLPLPTGFDGTSSSPPFLEWTDEIKTYITLQCGHPTRNGTSHQTQRRCLHPRHHQLPNKNRSRKTGPVNSTTNTNRWGKL
eukprot:2422339-Amphidinium_carterae.1